jgi:hypothetical protein
MTWVTPDYARDGVEHSKSLTRNIQRPNVLEARMCANFGNLGFVLCDNNSIFILEEPGFDGVGYIHWFIL